MGKSRGAVSVTGDASTATHERRTTRACFAASFAARPSAKDEVPLRVSREIASSESVRARTWIDLRCLLAGRTLRLLRPLRDRLAAGLLLLLLLGQLGLLLLLLWRTWRRRCLLLLRLALLLLL